MLRITFDPIKDAANIAKHGLSLDDAALVFNAPGKLTLESTKASESRLMDIALVQRVGVVLVLVYVLREPNAVRASALRRASKHERSLYASWQETRRA